MNLTSAWLRCKAGETVTFSPKGNSMKGLIESGEQVRVAPCIVGKLEIDDVVLVKVKGSIYLHKIKAVQGEKYLIGNNRGGLNGWVKENNIAGLCIEVSGRLRPRTTGKLFV